MPHKHSILCIDTDNDNLEILRDILSYSFTVIPASNSRDAINALTVNPLGIHTIVLDYNFLSEEDKNLFLKFQELGFSIPVLVLLPQNHIERRMAAFRRGAFDYILKPIVNEELLMKVSKAIELYELRKFKRTSDDKKEKELQERIYWNTWRENKAEDSLNKEKEALVENLRTSLSQGKGFGNIISCLNLIKAMAIVEGTNCLIPLEAMDLLYESAVVAEDVIRMLEKIENVIRYNLKTETIHPSEILKILEILILEIEEYSQKRGIEFIVGTFPETTDKSIMIDKKHFADAVKELLFNALRFSSQNSNVYILFRVETIHFCISILNSPREDLPEKQYFSEDEKYILEPFFRNTKVIFEDIPGLDSGLGLTYADRVIKKHGGSLNLSCSRNHLDTSGSEYVNVIDLRFPLI
ncbi:MAG: response regulator [Leptospiraceae bacterium]|nr:response regulator [Leptospiraceae bacterium]